MASDDSTDILEFYVNGKKVVEKHPRPEQTLLSYLRENLGLCGTKLGCGEGGCGACTVMVSFLEAPKAVRHISVNACLAPVVSMHGMAVTTVEGIGSTKTRLHEVQQTIANSHGSQCGFCTPGIVMSMYTLLRNNPRPEQRDLMTYFQGNLCRCTGYRPILEGFKSFTEAEGGSISKTNGCGKTNCCMNGDDFKNMNGHINGSQGNGMIKNGFVPEDESQVPIFPPELLINGSKKYFHKSLIFKSEKMSWFRPTTIQELLHLKMNRPNAKIVNGNTELGIEMKFKNCKYPIMIHPSQVPEMNDIEVMENGIKFGSAVSLSKIEEICLEQMASRPPRQVQILEQIVQMLEYFGGKQIRNVATLGGNIMTGSPISDLNPILMASKCEIEVRSLSNPTKQFVMDSSFYTGYRSNILAGDEVLINIKVPFTNNDEYFVAFKQARRRDDDIAIVNSAFLFRVDINGIIRDANLAFGGMAPTTEMPKATMDFMKGRLWNRETIEQACDILLNEMPLPPDVPGAMVRYRRSLAISFLFKAFLSISQSHGLLNLPDEWLSASEPFKKHEILSHQDEGSSVSTVAVGKSVIHKSAKKQATGEAVYTDDIPKYENELHMAFVLSKESHAEILNIDAKKVLAMPGVVDFISSKDLPVGKNNFCISPLFEDEQVFHDKKVTSVGQIICGIVAINRDLAQEAAKLVQVQYKKLPPIITIKEAIAANAYFPNSHQSILTGDPEAAFQTCFKVIEGEMSVGGQEHFYMETMNTIAVPSKEDGEMIIIASNQNPTDAQQQVARILGVPMNKVVCKVKRLGGGFGGKEARNIPLIIATAVGAANLQRPVRVSLDRDEDMVFSGHRHPFLGRYKAGFDQNGKLIALDLDLFSNAGCTLDLSFAVMFRAIHHCENAYKIENVHVRGHVCKTNLPSNTAFRGFGAPQAMLIMENIMDEVAVVLNKNPMDIRYLNLYQEGDMTHYDEVLSDCHIRRCWSECAKQSHYETEYQKVQEFNKQNRWKKRGISMIPVKYGISFGLQKMEQAGALVQVYRDGSVLLTHGGTEMGQGLHTKMIQIASQILGISQDYIHISETSTDKVPNTTPTAASSSSDLNGMAVLNACKTIMERLEPMREDHQTWEQVVMKAYVNRISLSATGFYHSPNRSMDDAGQKGHCHNYFTYGVCCSIVEIDCLTGDHNVIRTDIVMDLGQSLNPAIDIGQIEGAFAQGYGLFVLEQLLHTPEGDLITKGPGAYKLPSFGDVPSVFNVAILKNSSNPRAVFSSKAVGEPPLFLASSVFFAIKDAIRSARKDHGMSADISFFHESPATAERIRMACEDQMTAKVQPLPSENSFRPWAIQT